MDKLQYKDMLADSITDLNTAENEINRLQLLVAKYSDQQRQLTKMVYDNPNNMSLGKAVRSMYFEENKKSNT